jgi:hypothetical protein
MTQTIAIVVPSTIMSPTKHNGKKGRVGYPNIIKASNIK